jgi:hypothetical protein
MKYICTFEKFNEEEKLNTQKIEFEQGQTYMCVANIDKVFKKGAIFKINKIENGILELEGDNKIGIDEAKQIFIKHKLDYTKIDRTEQYDNKPVVVLGAEQKNIMNI